MKAILFCENKSKFVESLRGVINQAPKTLEALNAVAEFHLMAGELKAVHQTFKRLPEVVPGDLWPFEFRSLAAIAAGDTEDHFYCGREMFRRLNAEKRKAAEGVLFTFFLTPRSWTADELAQARRIYDEANENFNTKLILDLQVQNRVPLALADFRLGRYESALEQLSKAPLTGPVVRGFPWARGQAFAVMAMIHAQLGNLEKASEALRASEEALATHDQRLDPHEITRWKCLFEEAKGMVIGKVAAAGFSAVQ